MALGNVHVPCRVGNMEAVVVVVVLVVLVVLVVDAGVVAALVVVVEPWRGNLVFLEQLPLWRF
jgi:hypothetical protein